MLYEKRYEISKKFKMKIEIEIENELKWILYLLGVKSFDVCSQVGCLLTNMPTQSLTPCLSISFPWFDEWNILSSTIWMKSFDWIKNKNKNKNEKCWTCTLISENPKKMKNKNGRFKLNPFEPLHLEQTPGFTNLCSCLNLGGSRKKLELPIMVVKVQFFPPPPFIFPSFLLLFPFLLLILLLVSSSSSLGYNYVLQLLFFSFIICCF